MKRATLIQPKLKNSTTAQKVIYSTQPYQTAVGVTRAMQRFAAIALTTIGTDILRPWLGTKLPVLIKMNVRDRTELELMVRDELRQAITQFFTIQSQEANLEPVDIIDSITIVSVDVDTDNTVTATVLFTPRIEDAKTLSLEVI